MNLRSLTDWGHRVHLLLVNVNSDGKAKCFIREKLYDFEDLDVAHLFDRNRLNTRYNYKNTNLIHKNSNRYDSSITDKDKYGSLTKHHFEYTSAFLKTYSKTTYDRLLLKSKKTIRQDSYELKDKIKLYTSIAKVELQKDNLHPRLITYIKKYINASEKKVTSN